MRRVGSPLCRAIVGLVLLVILLNCEGDILSPVAKDLGIDISTEEEGWGDAGNPFASQCEEIFDESAPGEQIGKVSFLCVHPIFEEKCATCHTIGDQGNVNVGNPNPQLAYDNSQEPSYSVPGETIGGACMVRIHDGSMPSGKGCTGKPNADRNNQACLDKTQIDMIQAWIDTGQLYQTDLN